MGGKPLISVLVPTHDHGPTLRYSVASALAQEVEGGLEVLIVGDGMPAEAAVAAREVAAADERARLFEFPKGERHGEAHRHEVLASEARGSFVFYLCDDDLWLPDHVTRLVGKLRAGADFVAGTAVKVRLDGSLFVQPHDLSRPETRPLLLGEPPWNPVPLSVGAHTAEAYRRLEVGWTPAPEGIWSDLFFLRKFAAVERLQLESVNDITCITPPAALRAGISISARLAELESWAARLSGPEQLPALRAELELTYREKAIDAELEHQQTHRWLLDSNRWARDLAELAERCRSRVAQLESRLEAIEGSRAWRAIERARSTRAWRAARGPSS